jgi:hypothetical protein
MTYGLWYAVFAEHQALDGIGTSLTAGFTSAAHRDQANSTQALQRYREAKYDYDRQVDAHSHWLGLAMVLIVVGIGIDYLHLSRKQKLFLAWGLLIGSVLFPLSVLLQTVNGGPGPKILAVLGSALVILTLAAAITSVLRRPAAA